MTAVLFLDDDTTRQRRFAAANPGARITATAAETITMLMAQSWNVVHLDHDLGGEVYVDSNRKDTGAEVVRWILANRPRIGRVVVHTWNTVAGPRMSEDLQRAGYDAVWVRFALAPERQA